MKLFDNFKKRVKRVKTMIEDEKRGFSDLTIYNDFNQIHEGYKEETPLENILILMNEFSVLNVEILGSSFKQIPSDNPGKLTLIRYRKFNYFLQFHDHETQENFHLIINEKNFKELL